MENIKLYIKVFFAYSLYSLVINQPIEWKKDTMRWTFVLYPRKFNILILTILISPILILYSGINGVFEIYKNSCKKQSWSSYEFYLLKGIKPKRIDCYKKF